MQRPIPALAGAVLAALGTCAPAFADPDLFSPQAFSGLIDLRAAGADGQPSFLQGGFGKARFGGDASGDLDGHVALADAALVWQPQFTWDLGATIDAEHQDGQKNAVDLVQGYLTFRPSAMNGLKVSARAGLYYPPISEEHEGPTWSTVDTITPSAIDSWVGEEVKVVGGEAKVTGRLGEQELTATAGLFGFNDTSGTLLAFRGWALQDVKSTAFGRFLLPPLSDYYVRKQPPYTSNTLDVDGRVGYYARIDWRPPGRFTFNAFYYNNDGDKVSHSADWQWAWSTQFWNFGARWDIDDSTHLLSQVMTGSAEMGYPRGGSYLVNIGYTSAYFLASHSIGKSGLSGRVEYFEVTDHNFHPATDDPDDSLGETGWALTGAYRYQFNAHLRLMLEAMRIDSRRPSLEYAGLEPRQLQTVVQTSLRFGF